ncbi:cupin domain-containing protein [Sphingobium sp. LMA1-1-1.1]|uniref:cupin domain-containing protein n=1 Tax=unclassified Sphingobium TaxID=2611147 RepID=UPI0034331C98
MDNEASNATSNLVVSKLVVAKLHGEEDFKSDGLRPFAKYRDLGFAEVTDGMLHAHVIKLVPPCTDEVRKRHRHITQVQMFYMLEGWMKLEFEGHGEVLMEPGDCCLMPSGIAHTVLDYSPDARNLEITIPKEYDTIDA